MGNLIDLDKDFHWEYTEAPHAARRVEILKKHPEIKKLMRPNGDHVMVAYGIFLIILHFSLAYLHMSIPYTFLRVTMTVFVSSFTSSAIFLQMHEACHGLTFGHNHVWKNRLYGYFLNFGIGFPIFSRYKKIHKTHHKYQGEKDIDVEYPYEFELKYFNGSLGKYIWMLLNTPFQAVRDGATRESLLTKMNNLSLEEKINGSTLMVFNFYLLFNGYFSILSYQYFGFFVAGSFQFIGLWNNAVHTEFFDNEDTMCYYGWANMFMSNFGYHVEHHDFPNIPSRFLPQVRKLAPDFYEQGHQQDSLLSPTIKFIFDPKYGVFSRVKRDTKRPFINHKG